MRKASAIELNDAQREKLVKLAHSNTTEVRLARRASIVLLAADGLDNYRIGEMLGVGRIQAGRWRERYAGGGLQAIEQDLPRGGRKPKVDPAEIVRLTTQTTPEGATQWSTRTLAAVAGVSDTTIQRIWKARGLKPHRARPATAPGSGSAQDLRLLLPASRSASIAFVVLRALARQSLQRCGVIANRI